VEKAPEERNPSEWGIQCEIEPNPTYSKEKGGCSNPKKTGGLLALDIQRTVMLETRAGAKRKWTSGLLFIGEVNRPGEGNSHRRVKGGGVNLTERCFWGRGGQKKGKKKSMTKQPGFPQNGGSEETDTFRTKNKVPVVKSGKELRN